VCVCVCVCVLYCCVECVYRYSEIQMDHVAMEAKIAYLYVCVLLFFSQPMQHLWASLTYNCVCLLLFDNCLGVHSSVVDCAVI